MRSFQPDVRALSLAGKAGLYATTVVGRAAPLDQAHSAELIDPPGQPTAGHDDLIGQFTHAHRVTGGLEQADQDVVPGD